MDREEFKNVVKQHSLYLAGQGGKRADFSRQNLTGLSLVGEDLREAVFVETNLSYTRLDKAKLQGANFGGANLAYARLVGANCRYTSFEWANLLYADLRSAYLEDATLSMANLHYADLTGATAKGARFVRANLSFADISSVAGLSPCIMDSIRIVPEEGSFVGWATPCRDSLVKVLIPEYAIRANDTRRVCRASHVISLQVIPGDEWHEDLGFTWGEITHVEWDGNPFQGGIEFRLTRREAEADMW